MKVISKRYFLGIDVGTGSVRAGIFDAGGRMVGFSSHPIETWRPAPDHVEQSSDDIWNACCKASRAARKSAGIESAAIKGVGFDATCSLVLLDAEDRPVTASTSGKSEQNVLVWMDHRAIIQAERISRTKHAILRFVGGIISPEMQIPKLLWLKEKLPKSWRNVAQFFDLADFLTYRATGNPTRSLCTTVCKWGYLGQNGLDGAGWDASYFNLVGLGDLVHEKYRRIGNRIRPIGEAIGSGLSAQAALDLELEPGTPVGAGAIDAHAGGLGLLGARVEHTAVEPLELDRRIALIGGTSSCHMAVSRKPLFIQGIWGPYFSAMIPGLWLTEGGQSATGALIDHVIDSHSASRDLKIEAKSSNTTIYDLLNARLKALEREAQTKHPAELTRHIHIQPDFHGNRSPYADATLRGSMSGLTLSATADDLALQYLAAIQAIAYGTRHIIFEMNRHGYAIDTIFAAGGGIKNPVFLREHANITGCRVALPREPEAVLLGSAVIAAVASGAFLSIVSAMQAMNSVGSIITPSQGEVSNFHASKYRVFLRLHSDFIAYRKLMRAA